MNDITNKRIYAQMRPDSDGLARLESVQSELPKQPTGRLIGPEELHLTLIHFGEVSAIFDSVRAVADVDAATFTEQLDKYVAETSALLPSNPITLQFGEYELFGSRRNALAACFSASREILMLHNQLVDSLVTFLESIGIENAGEFIRSDANLCWVRDLRPHVTLYKGYTGDLPTKALDSVRFESMRVVY